MESREREDAVLKGDTACNKAHDCVLKVWRKNTSLTSTSFTIQLENQIEKPASMSKLYDFVIAHVKTSKNVCFTLDTNHLDSHRDLENNKMQETTISEFVNLQNLKKLFIHRESKRYTKKNRDEQNL